MQSLLVAFLAVVTTGQTSLVARYAVLMSFNATSFSMTITSQLNELVGQIKDGVLSLPTQRQVGS